MAYRQKAWIPERGGDSRSIIIALQNSVNLTKIDGTFLCKKGDTKEYDFDVLRCARTTTARAELNNAISRGMIKVKVIPKNAEEKAAARAAANEAAELESIESVEEPVPTVGTSEEDDESSSGVELSSSSSEVVIPSSSSEESSSSSSEETESESEVDETNGQVPDADPDKDGQQVVVDVEELKENVLRDLEDLNGVSARMSQQIFDLEVWDRRSVEDVKFMRDANVQPVLEILHKHREAFGK